MYLRKIQRLLSRVSESAMANTVDTGINFFEHLTDDIVELIFASMDSPDHKAKVCLVQSVSLSAAHSAHKIASVL